MIFTPIGLSSKDGIEKFFAPQVAGLRSFSKQTDQRQGESTEIFCEVFTLKSIMKRLQHNCVDLLKMDIEGFEYDVIDQMMASNTKPQCLLIEFHHLSYGIGTERTDKAVANLLAGGYNIFWISELGREYGFFLGEPEKSAFQSSPSLKH